MKKLTAIALALTSTVFSVWIAISRIAFGTHSEYDDQGYMLLSSSHFMHEGGLYTRTFSQYGPFYFLVQPFLHQVFGIPVSVDGSLALTTIYLLSSCFLLALFVLHLSRNWLWACVCFVGAVPISFVIIQESGHPQELILLLTEMGVCLGLFTSSRALPWALACLGALGGFEALTKINVGGFFLAAVCLTLTCCLIAGRSRTVLLATISITCVALPVWLMHHHFTHWSLPFCVLSVTTLLGLCWAATQISVSEPIPLRLFWAPLAGALAATGLISGWALSQGDSIADLVNGVILRPLTHPNVFSLPLVISPATLGLFMTGALLLAMTWKFQSRFSDFALRLAWTKIIVGVLELLALVNVRLFLYCSAEFFPLLLMPAVPGPQPRAHLLPRVLLCSVLSFQILQAYPVAGSHLNVTMTAAAAWASLLIYDGISSLTPNPGRTTHLFKFASSPLSVAVLATVLSAILFAKVQHRKLENGPSLDLPGSHALHLNPNYAARFRWLAGTLHENCDVLYGIPELGSLNFWAEVPTPNGLNMGGWPTAFTHAEQQSIVDVLRRTPRACIVHNEKLRRFWAPYGERKDAPLVDYIFTETKPVSQSGDYEIRIVKTSVSQWREDVILDHEKLLTGDAIGLPEGLLSHSPESTIRFSLQAKQGKLSVESSGGNTAGLPHLLIHSNRIVLRVGPSAAGIDVSGIDVSGIDVSGIDDGRWHQYTLVTTAASHQLFVDGILRVTIQTAAAYRVPDSLYLLSGTAMIRDFKVVRHAWSANQVSEWFRAANRTAG